jgi:hypothetical protein
MLANVARRLEPVGLFQYCSELKRRNNCLRKGTFLIDAPISLVRRDFVITQRSI